jgi:hypothetical protein
MAIISCPECGRQVSDKVLKCPQCAYPIANISSQKSEYQNDIDSTGKLISNKKDKEKFIVSFILILFSCGFVSAIIITFQMAGYNPFKSNFKSDSPKTDTLSSSSPEYLLAGIDKQSKDVSASELVPYTQVLDQLVSKCQESRMALADLSAWTQDELKKKGVEATHLKIMNAVYQSVQPYTTSQRCESSFVLISKIVNK